MNVARLHAKTRHSGAKSAFALFRIPALPVSDSSAVRPSISESAPACCTYGARRPGPVTESWHRRGMT